MFWQPFTDEDVAKIWEGRYPSRIGDPYEQAVRGPYFPGRLGDNPEGSRTTARLRSHEHRLDTPALGRPAPDRRPATRCGAKGEPPGWRPSSRPPPRRSVSSGPRASVPSGRGEAAELGALPEPNPIRPNDWYWFHDPGAVDDRQVATAQDLFVRNGGEIAGALLMAALPATYAARTGAEVLATGELQSNARRRIAETAQLTVDVLFPDENKIYDVDEGGANAR